MKGTRLYIKQLSQGGGQQHIQVEAPDLNTGGTINACSYTLGNRVLWRMKATRTRFQTLTLCTTGFRASFGTGSSGSEGVNFDPAFCGISTTTKSDGLSFSTAPANPGTTVCSRMWWATPRVLLGLARLPLPPLPPLSPLLPLPPLLPPSGTKRPSCCSLVEEEDAPWADEEVGLRGCEGRRACVLQLLPQREVDRCRCCCS